VTEPLLHVALFQPEIPQNTGNIGRLTCANGLRLHLIEPLGFSLSEKAVRRAGLDYWKQADIVVHRDFEALLEALPGARIAAFSKRAATPFTAYKFRPGEVLLFGRETTGIPAAILERPGLTALRIPLRRPGIVRSLNLANAVAVASYEALRQIGSQEL